MSKQSQGLTLFMIGLTHVAAVIMGLHTRYVKPNFGYALVVTGIALVVFGAMMIFEHAQDENRAAKEGHDHDHDHKHDHGDHGDHGHSHGHGDHDHDDHDCEEEHAQSSRAGWALFAPVITFALILPPALGAAAVERQAGTGRKAPETQQKGQELEPLPEGDPVELPINLFWRHVFTDEAKTLKDRRVKMIGFAMPEEGKDTWFLARLSLSCCAADAFAYTVQIKGQPAPAKDQWVEVTGVLDEDIPAEDDPRPPVLVAEAVSKVDPPAVPYLNPNP